MTELRFDAIVDETEETADAVLGDTSFDVLEGARDLRRVRAAFMELARHSIRPGSHRGILVLDEPPITDQRLHMEWAWVAKTFLPEVLGRIAMVIHRDGMSDEVLGSVSREESACVSSVIDHVRGRGHRAPRRPSSAFFEVLKLLLVHWFRRTGPITTKDLGEEAGLSYPTIAQSLRKLERHVVRHSDRRIELRSFPRDAWFELVAGSQGARTTLGFSDRSRRPRPIEALSKRIQEIGNDRVAIGGVDGARFHFPDLDVVGLPRLDVVVRHGAIPNVDTFIQSIDAALRPTSPNEVPQVVLHTLYRKTPFFVMATNGKSWADEVECLLDLHEMRMEPQALEFLDQLIERTRA